MERPAHSLPEEGALLGSLCGAATHEPFRFDTELQQFAFNRAVIKGIHFASADAELFAEPKVADDDAGLPAGALALEPIAE